MGMYLTRMDDAAIESALAQEASLARWREQGATGIDAARAAPARAARADQAVREAGDVLKRCDPDDGDPRTASARVALTAQRVAYLMRLAEAWDRPTYGQAVKVDADVKVAALVAFVSNAVRSTTSVVDLEATPKVVPPDGADKDA